MDVTISDSRNTSEKSRTTIERTTLALRREESRLRLNMIIFLVVVLAPPYGFVAGVVTGESFDGSSA